MENNNINDIMNDSEEYNTKIVFKTINKIKVNNLNTSNPPIQDVFMNYNKDQQNNYQINPNPILNNPFYPCNFQNSPGNNFNPPNLNYNPNFCNNNNNNYNYNNNYNNNNYNYNNYNNNYNNYMNPTPNMYGFYNQNNFGNFPYQQKNFQNNLIINGPQENNNNYFLRKGNGILINDEISNFIAKICKKAIDNCIKSNNPKIKEIQANYIIKYLKELIKGEWFVFICESSLDNFDFKFSHIKEDNILVFSYNNYKIYICLLYITMNVSMNFNSSVNFDLKKNLNKNEIKENNIQTNDKDKENTIINNNNNDMIKSKAKINNINGVENKNINNANMMNSRVKININENIVDDKNDKKINNDNMKKSRVKININENINNDKNVNEDLKKSINNKGGNDKIIYENIKKNIEIDIDENDFPCNKTFYRIATNLNPNINIQNKIENNKKKDEKKNMKNNIINNKKDDIQKREKEDIKINNENKYIPKNKDIENNANNNENKNILKNKDINNKKNIQKNINNNYNNNKINEKEKEKEKIENNNKIIENNENNKRINRRNIHNFINIRQYYKNKNNKNENENGDNNKNDINNKNEDKKEIKNINDKKNNNNIIINDNKNNKIKNNKKILNEEENEKPDDVVDYYKLNFFKNNIPVNNPDLEQNKKLYNELQRRVKRILCSTRLPQFNFDNYTIQKSIGEGTYGQLYFVINKKSNKKYAIKEQIAQNFNSLSDYLKTFEINFNNKHENILDIYGIYVVISEENLFFVYALMDLGECDWEQEIEKRKNSQRYYTEMELISILKQLVSALSFLQKRSIAHRDIKLENILLFSKKEKNSRIIPEKIYKICDFGEAKKRIKYNTKHNTVRGTDYYMSPELLEGLNNQKDYVKNNPHKSDVFSLGCCMIIAATLDYEFIENIRNKEKQEEIDDIIKSSLINYYSEGLINIISKMVVYDDTKRIDFIDLEKLIIKEFG